MWRRTSGTSTESLQRQESGMIFMGSATVWLIILATIRHQPDSPASYYHFS